MKKDELILHPWRWRGKKNASDETCYAYGVVAGVCVCNADL